MNQLGSRDEAEDAVQSTFLNAHRALQRGVEPEAELAWLFKIAHNVCLTRRRSTRRRGRVEAPSDLDAVQDVLPAPSRESADDLIRLTDALAHMPDNQRRAILLREWQGLSYHEIADELKLSQSAVETLIFRARRTLAANLVTEPERATGMLARVRQALDFGTLMAAAKGILVGGSAVKAAATAVAVTGAAVVATGPIDRPTVVPQAAEKPALVEAAAPTPAVESVNVVELRRAVAPAPAPKAEPKRVAAEKKPARPAAAAPAKKPAAAPPAAPSPEAAPEPAALTAAPAAAPQPAPAPAATRAPAPKQEVKADKKDAPPAAAPPSSNGQVNGKKADKPQPPGQAKKAEQPAPVPAPAPTEAPAAPVAEQPAAPPADPGNNGNGQGNGNGGDKDKGGKK